MGNTSYGIKGIKKSKFIIVAPHAAGDDIRTKELTLKISKNLACSFIINTNYYKPLNKKAIKNKANIEDFNRLSWNENKKAYNWAGKNRSMIDFFTDIDSILNYNKDFRNNVIVYIHGHAGSESIGIDIGVGGKLVDGNIIGTDSHADAGKNTGVITADRNKTLNFSYELNEQIKKHFDSQVTIGKIFAGWSRQDAVQHHANSDIDAIQLEFSVKLRRVENLDLTAKIVSENLLKIFANDF